MKEMIIIILILIIIIFGGIYIQKYLKESSQKLIEDLDKLKEKMGEEENIEQLKLISNEIYEKWKQTEESWSVIVLHSELDLIETSLIEMKTDIETGNTEKSKPELEKSIFLINHINEKEKINLKNIF